MIRVCIILSSESHFDKGLFDKGFEEFKFDIDVNVPFDPQMVYFSVLCLICLCVVTSFAKCVQAIEQNCK